MTVDTASIASSLQRQRNGQRNVRKYVRFICQQNFELVAQPPPPHTGILGGDFARLAADE